MGGVVFYRVGLCVYFEGDEKVENSLSRDELCAVDCCGAVIAPGGD